MRPYIPHLDTAAMDWASPIPGVYSKVLSVDPDNGARTAMQRLMPEEGYTAPKVPHYHHSAEELLVLKGRLSFDSKTYLGANGYCFHPPETVHGFMSDVPTETVFLSRHSKKMCTHEVPAPAKREYYPLNGTMPDRAWAALPDSTKSGWDDNVKILGEDSFGEGSKLMRFDGNTVNLSVPEEFYEEIFVMDGRLTTTDGTTFNTGGYAFCPPGSARPDFSSAEKALVYVNYGPA
jgi:glyoxylate utilization-related uncharacterized protein